MVLAVTLAGNGGGWLAFAAVIASGLCSGLLSAWIADRRARRIEPAQAKEMTAQASQTAVETVEAALTVARARIADLEERVSEFSEQVGELRVKLSGTTTNNENMRRALLLALIERAKLSQQITDIRAQLSHAGVEPVRVLPIDATFVVLANGAIEYVTDGVYDLLGFTPEELIGKPIETVIPPRERDHHVVRRIAFMDEHRARSMANDGLNIRALTANGDELRVRVGLHPTGDGRTLALLKRDDRRRGQRRSADRRAAKKTE